MKYLAVISALLMILFSGCQKSNPEIIADGFSARAVVKSATETTEYFIEAKENGNLKLTVLSPKILNGFQYIWNGESFTVSFKGIEQNLSDIKNSPDNFATALSELLFQLKTKPQIAKGGKKEGATNSGTFSLTVRPDGFLKTVSFNSLGLTASFSNSEYLF